MHFRLPKAGSDMHILASFPKLPMDIVSLFTSQNPLSDTTLPFCSIWNPQGLDYSLLRKHYTNIKWLLCRGNGTWAGLTAAFELQTTQALATLELAKM